VNYRSHWQEFAVSEAVKYTAPNTLATSRVSAMMDSLECKRLIKLTDRNIAHVYSLLRDKLIDHIDDAIRMSTTNWYICQSKHIVIPDLQEICKSILEMHKGYTHNDYLVMESMMKFTHRCGSEELPVSYLAKFAALGIKTPLVQHVLETYKYKGFTVFDVSNSRMSNKIFIQIVFEGSPKSPLDPPYSYPPRTNTHSLGFDRPRTQSVGPGFDRPPPRRCIKRPWMACSPSYNQDSPSYSPTSPRYD